MPPGVLYASCPAWSHSIGHRGLQITRGSGHKAFLPASVKTARVNGVDIGYSIVGQGPPLLMIMGYSGSMDKLDKIHARVLLMVGEKDDITPPIQNLYMAGKIEGAWLIPFMDAGHWMMYQYPEKMARASELFFSIQ